MRRALFSHLTLVTICRGLSKWETWVFGKKVTSWETHANAENARQVEKVNEDEKCIRNELFSSMGSALVISEGSVL